jgi:hypothetical protein
MKFSINVPLIQLWTLTGTYLLLISGYLVFLHVKISTWEIPWLVFTIPILMLVVPILSLIFIFIRKVSIFTKFIEIVLTLLLGFFYIEMLIR